MSERIVSNASESSGLADGWATASLLNLCGLVRGVSYKKGEAKTAAAAGLVSLVRANNIDSGLHFDGLQYVPRERVSEEQLLQVGDVVVAMSSGSKKVVGKAASLRSEWYGAFGAFCGVLRPSPQLEAGFFGYYFQTREYRDYISTVSAGTNINNLKREYFAKIDFPVPPLAEQKRIVAMVEQLLARVNAARERLAKVPAILKRFRQSVLAAACSGRLTADWRDAHPDIEPASDLRDAVAAKRRALWEASQAKSPRKRRYPAPIPTNERELPLVPDEWEWVSADEVCSQITDGEHIQPRYQPTGRPMLTAKHVRDGFVVFDDAGLISEKDFRKCLERCAATEGDILIVSVGATTGRTAIVRDCPAFALVRSVLLLRPLLPSSFFLRWTQSPWCQEWIGQASGASAQPHFYIRDTRRMPVPVPPLQEQHEIVRRVEALFNLADTIEQRVTAGKQRADRLTQAVLAKAFRGELVPTEAELARREGRPYEPASALLERIKADREKRSLDRRGGGRHQRRRTTTRQGPEYRTRR